METCYGSSTSYLMTWLWIPHASSRSSTYECGGLLRTFHLFSPRVSHSNTCRLLSLFVLCCCLSCCLVFVFFSILVCHLNRRQLHSHPGEARLVSYLMTWLWIPHASSRSSTYECGGLLRTFHLFSPRVSHSNTCRLLSLFVLCCCLSCCLVFVFLVPVLQVSRNPEFSAQFKKKKVGALTQ